MVLTAVLPPLSNMLPNAPSGMLRSLPTRVTREAGGTEPPHLDWSGHAEYDLSRPARLASMYKVVLTETSTVEDLTTWLSADLLRSSGPASGCRGSSGGVG